MATGIQLAPPPRRQANQDALAQAMMAQATDASPKGHPLAALAQALQGFMAGRMMHKSRTAEEERIARTAEALRGQFAGPQSGPTSDMAAMLGGGGPQQMATPATLEQSPGDFQPQGQTLSPSMMGQTGQAAFAGPAPPPDTRPQLNPQVAALAQMLIANGNPEAANQLLFQQLMPQQEEAYNLSPGQVRMRGSQVIGRGPERDQSQGGFTLSPGGARYNADGSLVAERPSAPPTDRRTNDQLNFEQAQREGFTGTFPQWIDRNQRDPAQSDRDQRGRKIQALVDQGVEPARAGNIVDGHERIELVPQTGMARIINNVDRTVREVPIGLLSAAEIAVASDDDSTVGDTEQSQQASAPGGNDPGPTMWEMAEAGTGVWSSARAGLSVPTGMFGMGVADATLQARQGLRLEARSLARSLVDNPKMPVRLVEMAIEDAAVSPSAIDSPQAMQSRIRALERYLINRLRIAEEDAADPSAPLDLRSAQATNARVLREFIPRLGVPHGPRPGSAKRPEAFTDELWNLLTPEEQARAGGGG